jgi:hypothetical protein
MKAELIDKLYKQLTPQENAALAFEALNRHDYQELDVIEGAIEKRLYKLSDYKYRSRLYDMMILSLWYGGIYWKNCAHYAFVLPLVTKTQDYFAVELASMESSLVEVCTRLNVDVASVKKMAVCDDLPVLTPDIFAVAEKVAYYTELFMGVIGDSGIG